MSGFWLETWNESYANGLRHRMQFDRISFWMVRGQIQKITEPHLSEGKQEAISLVIYCAGISCV